MRSHHEHYGCPEKRLLICKYAKAKYLCSSAFHDPSVLVCADNILLLLLRFVLAELDSLGLCDVTGWQAADAFTIFLCQQRHMTKRTQQWIKENKWVWIHVGEEMACALANPTVPTEVPDPTTQFSELVKVVRLDGGSTRGIGDWALHYEPAPPPEWYLESMRQAPSRYAVEANAAAQRLLTEQAN
jgi:hypothetical protein